MEYSGWIGLLSILFAVLTLFVFAAWRMPFRGWIPVSAAGRIGSRGVVWNATPDELVAAESFGAKPPGELVAAESFGANRRANWSPRNSLEQTVGRIGCRGIVWSKPPDELVAAELFGAKTPALGFK